MDLDERIKHELSRLRSQGASKNEVKELFRMNLKEPLKHLSLDDLAYAERLISGAINSEYGHDLPTIKHAIQFLEAAKAPALGPVNLFDQHHHWTMPRVGVEKANGQVSWLHDAFNFDTKDRLAITSVRRIMPRNLIQFGLPQLPIGFIVRGVFFDESNAISFDTDMALGRATPNGEWIAGSRVQRGRNVFTPSKDDIENCDFLGAYAHAVSTQWRADISLGTNTLRICIGPHEAKRLFALRDIPDGKNRRAALIHVVEQHTRARPYTREDTISVRRHLRGKESCKWDGCLVSIAAPQREYGELA